MKHPSNSKKSSDAGIIIAALLIGIAILGGTGYLSNKSGMAIGNINLSFIVT